MTGLNHAVTGAVVAAAINQPAVALPAAFLSHFVIDAIPHYDYVHLLNHRRLLRSFIAFDAIACLVFGFILGYSIHQHTALIIWGAIFGTLPDAMLWIPAILQRAQKKVSTPGFLIRVRQVHKDLQRETGWGILIEAGWLVLMSSLLIRFVN